MIFPDVVALTEVTAPASEPVTLQELKQHLRVDFAEEDDLITSIGKAARVHVETFTRRQIVTATYDVWYDRWPSTNGYFSIPRPPLQSVTTVKYQDADNAQQTLASSVYTVDTDSEVGRVYLAEDQSWPTIRAVRKAIEIRFVCGYATVPDVYKELVRLATQQYYDLGAVPAELPECFKRLAWGERVAL